jgi:dolichyl-phosphate-mannose--protein O-mannosyl transferase
VLGLTLALAGLFLWIYRLHWKRDQQAAVLLLLFAGYFLLMASSRRYFMRYAVPMVPFLALAAADVINWATERWSASGRRGVVLALTALVMVAALQPFFAAARTNILWGREDTRTIAKRWIEQNIPDGAKIASDWMVHGVPLATLDVPSPDSRWAYEVTEVNGWGLSDYPVEFYRTEGFNYVITTSYISDLDLVDPQQNGMREAFYRSLDTAFDPVKEFRPYAGEVEPPFIFDEIYGPVVSLWQRERPGPTIKIYRVQR